MSLAAGTIDDIGTDRSEVVAAVGRGEVANRVEFWNGAGRWRRVAASAWPDGYINWAGVSGDWVLYVDQSRQQDDGHMNVLWRIRAVNIATGARRLVATNGSKPDPWVPYLGSTPSGITWTEASPSRRANLYIWEGGHAVEVATDREMTAGSDRAAGHYVYFLGPNGKGLKYHTTGGDCWRVPRTGGTPRPVTRTALAISCTPGRNRLLVGLHLSPHVKKLPAEGRMDDPYTLELSTLTGGRPSVIERGYISDGRPVALGPDFVWENIDGALELSDAQGRTRRLGQPSMLIVKATSDTLVATDGVAHHGRVILHRFAL